jgi:hypothetical protein
MSVFMDRLMEKLDAAKGGGESVVAFVEHLVGELRGQSADGPVTVTGDVPADLEEHCDLIARAIMAPPGKAPDLPAPTAEQGPDTA